MLVDRVNHTGRHEFGLGEILIKFIKYHLHEVFRCPDFTFTVIAFYKTMSLLSGNQAGYRTTEVVDATRPNNALKWGAAAGTAMGIFAYTLAVTMSGSNAGTTLVSAAALRQGQAAQTIAPSAQYSRVAAQPAAFAANPTGAMPASAASTFVAPAYTTDVQVCVD